MSVVVRPGTGSEDPGFHHPRRLYNQGHIKMLFSIYCNLVCSCPGPSWFPGNSQPPGKLGITWLRLRQNIQIYGVSLQFDTSQLDPSGGGFGQFVPDADSQVFPCCTSCPAGNPHIQVQVVGIGLVDHMFPRQGSAFSHRKCGLPVGSSSIVTKSS